MKLAPLSQNIPQFNWEDVRVSFAPHQVERLKEAGLMDLVREMSAQGQVSSDELAAEPGRFLMCTRGSYGVTKLFDKVGADQVVLVWSMWSGYWERDGCAMREWAEREGVEPHFVHSGGHAWPEDLRPARRGDRRRSRRSGCTRTSPDLHSIVTPRAGRTSTCTPLREPFHVAARGPCSLSCPVARRYPAIVVVRIDDSSQVC